MAITPIPSLPIPPPCYPCIVFLHFPPPYPFLSARFQTAKYAYCLTKSPSRKLPVITDVTFIDAAVAFTPAPPFLPSLTRPPRLSLSIFLLFFLSSSSLGDYPSPSLHLSTYLPSLFFTEQPTPSPHPRAPSLLFDPPRTSPRCLRIHQRTRVAINSRGFEIVARFGQITRPRLPTVPRKRHPDWCV